jgi:tRNA(fMet)-specific endonuclease VapC
VILLDSDHLTVLMLAEDRRNAGLADRLERVQGESVAVTVVSVEEHTRGWLAAIKARTAAGQVIAYDRLIRLVRFLQDWEIVRFEEQAADAFNRLRKHGVRIGTQDLKIASIALTNDALLLSANLRDFSKVPGLRVENWLG